MLKQAFHITLFLLAAISVSAQSGLAGYESWLDADYANRTKSSGSGESVSQSIDISSLSTGIHYYNVRCLNTQGEWGSVYRYLFLVPGSSSALDMSGYESWIDGDYANRTKNNGSGESVTQAVDISSLSTGIHYYNVRCLNTQGEWGSVYRYLFYAPASSSSSEIAAYESWLDDDYANRIKNNGSGETVTQAVDISNVSPGVHYYNVRCLNTQGEWGSVYRYLFFIPEMEPSETVAAVNYWFDDETDVMTQPVNGNTITVSVDISHLPFGNHTFYYQLESSSKEVTDVYSYEFTLEELIAEEPVITHEGNIITISTSMMDDAVIYYTLDGTTPSASNGTLYEGPFEVTQNGVVKAVCVKADYTDSSVATLVVDWIPVGEATFDGIVATVSGERTLDEAFESVGGRSEAAKTIAAILWHKDTAMTDADLLDIDNPNLLVFVNEASQAPANINNVVVNGVAEHIVLKDTDDGNADFYCPQAFVAHSISYTHEYRMQTEIGVSRGWETIALPFAVQHITHETNGSLAPFNSGVLTGKPFWLGRLTNTGLANAETIEANVPYVISMPNNPTVYSAQYNQAGWVTFSAEDVTIPVTALSVVEGANVVLVPTFHRVPRGAEIFAINRNESYESYAEGSVFVADYREVRPFEAYTLHPNGVRQLIAIAELASGDLSGIATVMANLPMEVTWYTLDGRKLQGRPTSKGVYVIRSAKEQLAGKNGRKVVIR